MAGGRNKAVKRGKKGSRRLHSAACRAAATKREEATDETRIKHRYFGHLCFICENLWLQSLSVKSLLRKQAFAGLYYRGHGSDSLILSDRLIRVYPRP